MEEDNNRKEKQTEGKEVGGKREEEFEENDEQRAERENNNKDCTAQGSSSGKRGEFLDSKTQTFATLKVSESDLQLDMKGSSEMLSDVPVEYSLQSEQLLRKLKDSVRSVNKGSSLEISEQSENLWIPVLDRSSMLEASSASVTKSISSPKSPTLPDKKLQLADNGSNQCLLEQDKLSTQSPKPLPTISMTRTSDGYNWRKYGQKQVKSPEGSRSYYRCTFSNCHAKKIECCCHSNHAIETVYRSQHNHDPPSKLNCASDNRHVSPVVSVNGSKDAGSPVKVSSDPVPSASSKEPLLITYQKPESKQQESCGSDETTEIRGNEDHAEGPEYKRRQKRSSSGEVASLPTQGKKPKFVVHAAGDVGISGDGYRWRKYGQKMVKGNPHPRNYYRCTSTGCPVRKHTERAVDSTTSVVITYKGVHDHDMPLPTKRLRPKCARVDSVDNLQMRQVEPCHGETQWSVDREGGLTAEALNPGGERTLELRRTLLSIGFEIKPCWRAP